MDEWNRSQPDSLFCLSMSWAAWLLSPSDLWVWLAILLLLASGYWMLFTTFGGFVGAGPYIHLMQMIGWLMIALFVWLFHGPWLSFKRVVDSEDWLRGVEQSQPRELGLPVQEKSGIRGLSATPMW